MISPDPINNTIFNDMMNQSDLFGCFITKCRMRDVFRMTTVNHSFKKRIYNSNEYKVISRITETFKIPLRISLAKRFLKIGCGIRSFGYDYNGNYNSFQLFSLRNGMITTTIALMGNGLWPLALAALVQSLPEGLKCLKWMKPKLFSIEEALKQYDPRRGGEIKKFKQLMLSNKKEMFDNQNILNIKNDWNRQKLNIDKLLTLSFRTIVGFIIMGYMVAMDIVQAFIILYGLYRIIMLPFGPCYKPMNVLATASEKSLAGVMARIRLTGLEMEGQCTRMERGIIYLLISCKNALGFFLSKFWDNRVVLVGLMIIAIGNLMARQWA